MLVSFFILFYFWAAVSETNQGVGSYTRPQLYAYFIVGYVIRTLVFSTRTGDIGGAITSGDLSKHLLRPLSVLKFFFTRDLVDKLFNIFFMIFEFAFILFILKPQMILPSPKNLFYFLSLLVLAIVIFFFYSLVVSLATFWTDQAWSHRWLFGVVLVNIFSGQAIPLDLLPTPIFNILKFTPFPYLYYYPVKFWIDDSLNASFLPLFIQSLLILLVLFFLSRFFWKKGLIKYQGYGN